MIYSITSTNFIDLQIKRSSVLTCFFFFRMIQRRKWKKRTARMISYQRRRRSPRWRPRRCRILSKWPHQRRVSPLRSSKQPGSGKMLWLVLAVLACITCYLVFTCYLVSRRDPIVASLVLVRGRSTSLTTNVRSCSRTHVWLKCAALYHRVMSRPVSCAYYIVHCWRYLVWVNRCETK